MMGSCIHKPLTYHVIEHYSNDEKNVEYIIMFKCRKCNELKDHTEFKVHSNQCRECRNKSVREWRARNPDYHSNYWHVVVKPKREAEKDNVEVRFDD
jgi:hypothetical protein